MTRVAVSREMFSWAIERSGRTLDSLRERFPKLLEWQEGRALTLRQLERFAQVTATPLGYLFLERPPVEILPVPEFRTVRQTRARRPSADLLEIVYTMQRRQAWMREYLIGEGTEPLTFVDSARLEDSSQSVAGRICEALHLERNWATVCGTWSEALRQLRQAMEKAGILVVASSVVGNNTHRKLDVEEFRGFVLIDDFAPLVFVNAADARAAQMFTLAHELAHVWFGRSAAFDLRQMQPADETTEQASNRVAAEFLVPESALQQAWPTARQDPEPFQAIARQFKVSALVAARRVLDLGLVRKAQFLEFYQAYLKDERRKEARVTEGGDFYATQGLRVSRRFARAVIQAAREGKLLYREAYELTGLYGKTFEAFASRLEKAGSP